MTPRVLLTIPVHNEADRLYDSVQRLRTGMASTGLDFQLAIAEDGSTDGTSAVLDRLESELPDLLVQRIPERSGRGLALRRLWAAVEAEAYVFVDADLPAEPKAIADVVRALDHGADVATGSRYSPGARVHRPPLRNAVSRGYNELVRLMFNEPIRDHQCGLKAFRRSALADLLPLSKEDSWAWDTEILVLAHARGLRVVEIPIDWTEFRYHRTPVRRVLSDVFLHGSALLRLRRDLVTRVPNARPMMGFGARSGVRLPGAAPLPFPSRRPEVGATPRPPD
jgi:glycosyltransferase involved in cell wall biosynthesis